MSSRRFFACLRAQMSSRTASAATFKRTVFSGYKLLNATSTRARYTSVLIASAGFAYASSNRIFAAEEGWIEIDALSVEDLEDGEMKAVPTGQGKTKILIARVDGKFYAVSNSCTHAGAPMDTGLLVGGRVLCPWHNAAFSVVTGAGIDMPARDGLDTYPVEVRGGRVFVRVPPNVEQRQAIEPAMASLDVSKDPRTFLVVGAGPAAQVAVETLRAEGYCGRITMVTSDTAAPYDRTRLSKALGVPADKLALRPADWHASHGVELLTGKEVKLLDTQSKVAVLSDGGQISFDKVLIASGSTPRKLKVPGADLRNVHTLRSAADSAAIKAAASGGAKCAVVVGASFIGIETASALKDALKVDRVVVVGMEAVPMERVLGRHVGSVIQKMGEEKGVEFLMRRTVARLEGADGAVRKVVLDNGLELPADVVVVGAGVVPNTGFVSGVAKAQDGSIKVDSFMRAGGGGVYAAGDVANFPYALTGERARIEHWNVAQQQGRTAGRNLAGARASTYTTVPYFWSAFFGGKLSYVGYNGGHDDVHVEGDVLARKFIAYYGRDGAVVAAATMGVPNAGPALAEALRLGKMPGLGQLRAGSASIDTIRADLRSSAPGCGRASCCSKPKESSP